MSTDTAVRASRTSARSSETSTSCESMHSFPVIPRGRATRQTRASPARDLLGH
jgi:hypothetical protein